MKLYKRTLAANGSILKKNKAVLKLLFYSFYSLLPLHLLTASTTTSIVLSPLMSVHEMMKKNE